VITTLPTLYISDTFYLHVTRGIMINLASMVMILKSGVEVIQRVSEACWVSARSEICSIHDNSMDKKNGFDGTMWRLMNDAERSYFLLGIQFGVIEASEWILINGLPEISTSDAAKMLNDVQKELDRILKGEDPIVAAKNAQMIISKTQRYLQTDTAARRIMAKADDFSNQLE